MTILYVGQGFKESHALGAMIRRAGVQKAFIKRGLELETSTLRRRSRFIAEVFSVQASKAGEAGEVVERAAHSDVTYLEGLAVAVATIAAIRRRRPSGLIHVDVCDSWIRLSGAGVGAGSSLRARTAKYLKIVLAVLALRYVTKYADSVSYISLPDLQADARYLNRNTRRFVMPNGNPVGDSSKAVSWDRNGPMVVVGDWSYPPNQSMLSDVLEWFPRIDGHTETAGLNIVGPNLSVPAPGRTSIAVLGWVDQISTAYDGVSCAVAVTTSGGGVKNKVLEPLSYGIPVIATREALSGLSYDPSMVLVFHERLSSDEVRAWLDGLNSLGRRTLEAPSWDTCVSELVSYITDGSAL